MGRPGSDHLRTTPRQERSRARVEVILAAAEDVFEQVGFEQATTAMVASAADVPIGTLYRWFPDKAALALALCERYLDDIERLYDDLLSVGADEPIAVLIRRVLTALERFATERKALGAIASTTNGLGTGGPDGAGDRLRSALAGHVQLLVELRVPGIDVTARDEVTDAIVTVVNAFLVRAGECPPERRPGLFHDLGDFVIAFVEAKFPVPESPVWDDLDAAPVAPLLPGRDVAGPA
jgi:AcrR family transcriptional regulator